MAEPSTILADPQKAADEAGLVYVSDDQPGISRHRSGRGFSYRLPGGQALRHAGALARIRALAIPPAWTDVWICPDTRGHIQATGRDQRGRKQYRYHPQWRDVRDAAKYDHMIAFAQVLPRLRARVDADMRLPGLPREKVLATVVHLLERTLIRVGNDDYARQNQSFGLTTLRNRHVAVEGSALRFAFKGKSGRIWRLRVQDRRIARIIRACQDLPGQELFQYRDENGEIRRVTSGDVNAYLRDVAGFDVTAKDFRTWAGTVLAAQALQDYATAASQAAAQRNLQQAIRQVAARLGNTVAICRKCYIHPRIISLYLEALAPPSLDTAGIVVPDTGNGLRPEEAAVLALLQQAADAAA